MMLIADRTRAVIDRTRVTHFSLVCSLYDSISDFIFV